MFPDALQIATLVRAARTDKLTTCLNLEQTLVAIVRRLQRF